VFRRNGEDMVGIGIVAQAKANVVAVVDGVRARMDEVNRTLPSDIQLYPSSDSSVYIRAAIDEVYRTLFVTALVVVGVIFLFLGSGLATMIPALTVPVSLVGTFFVLDLLGFSVNLLTLLGLVLAIGLVVDDAIVVLENISRRIRAGEPPLRAAFLGTRQVGFAVVATTVVLVAVLVPVTFVEGNTGRLFTEFALALAGAVVLTRADAPGAKAQLTIDVGGEADLAPAELADAFGHNPQVGILDLIDAVQRGATGALRLDRGKGRGYLAHLRA